MVPLRRCRIRRHFYARTRDGRNGPPGRFEVEHIDEFRRVTLPFSEAELKK